MFSWGYIQNPESQLDSKPTCSQKCTFCLPSFIGRTWAPGFRQKSAIQDLSWGIWKPKEEQLNFSMKLLPLSLGSEHPSPTGWGRVVLVIWTWVGDYLAEFVALLPANNSLTAPRMSREVFSVEGQGQNFCSGSVVLFYCMWHGRQWKVKKELEKHPGHLAALWNSLKYFNFFLEMNNLWTMKTLKYRRVQGLNCESTEQGLKCLCLFSGV